MPLSNERPIRRADSLPMPRLDYPDGTMVAELVNLEYQAALGAIASRWSHIEELMASLFGTLLAPDPAIPSRIIYNALNGAEKRRQVMQALLQKAEQNVGLGPEFDDLLGEFDGLRKRRNAMVHGLWWTHHETEHVYLQEADVGQHPSADRRRVELDEMLTLENQMLRFFTKIFQARRTALRHHIDRGALKI